MIFQSLVKFFPAIFFFKMADLDDFEFWRSIMGDSDDEQSDVAGFTLEQVAGRDD